MPATLAPFIIRWGAEASSDVLRQSAVCRKCGHKGATLVHPSVDREVDGTIMGLSSYASALAGLYTPRHSPGRSPEGPPPIHIHCLSCASPVTVFSLAGELTPCPSCGARFSSAVAFLREKGNAIGAIGDAAAPFETPDALARAADPTVQAAQSIVRNRMPGWKMH